MGGVQYVFDYGLAEYIDRKAKPDGHVQASDAEILVSGIADAVWFNDSEAIEVVVDWKSDVRPSQETVDHYRRQINDYRKQTGAKR